MEMSPETGTVVHIGSPAAPSAVTTAPVVRNPVRWLVFAVVIAANIMDLMDATIVNVAGPSIRVALGGSASFLQWLPAGYTLAFAVFLITGARLGDMFGRRRLFLIGSAGFTLMSAACALAPSPGVLIVFRVLQGAFGALMIPQGFGMIKEVFDEDEITKVFGAFGPMMGLSILAAPILAGALVEANLWGIGWRLVFLINVPIGIVAFAGAVRVLPRTVAHPGLRLDVGGMALIGVALTAVIYPLIQGRAEGWPAWTFVSLAAGAALLGVFWLWERRRRGDPLIEPRLLANRTYTSGILVALAFFGAFGGLVLCVSLFAQLGEHFSPIHAGLTLMAMVIGMIAGMGVGMALVARLGRHLLQLGVVVVAAGTIVLALTVTGAHSASTLDLAPGLFLIGLGAGSSIGQLFDFILAGVGMDEVGSASGVLEAVQQLSSALGVAALGTIFFSAFDGHLPTHALAVTAWACLVPLAATFLLVFKLPMHAREPQI
jgi:EmrB/QacA subfamily drug resistance transporter